MAREDKNVVAISAAMLEGTGLTQFEKEFPDRTYDVGIAEAHAVVAAAGMACEGLRPWVCIYSTFLQRAIDPIIALLQDADPSSGSRVGKVSVPARGQGDPVELSGQCAVHMGQVNLTYVPTADIGAFAETLSGVL